MIGNTVFQKIFVLNLISYRACRTKLKYTNNYLVRILIKHTNNQHEIKMARNTCTLVPALRMSIRQYFASTRGGLPDVSGSLSGSSIPS